MSKKEKKNNNRLKSVLPGITSEFPILKENYELQKTSRNILGFVKKEYSYDAYLKATNTKAIDNKARLSTWIIASIIYSILLYFLKKLCDNNYINVWITIVVILPLTIFLSFRYIISYKKSLVYKILGNYATILEDEYYSYMLGISEKEYNILKRFLNPCSLYDGIPVINVFVVNSLCEKGYFKKYFNNDIPLPMEDIKTVEDLIEFVRKNDKTRYYF